MSGLLITGGAGFLGSHFFDRQIKEGQDVLCVDNFFQFQTSIRINTSLRRCAEWKSYCWPPPIFPSVSGSDIAFLGMIALLSPAVWEAIAIPFALKICRAAK